MRGRNRAAVTAVFAVNGATFASLFSRLPDLQRQHGLTDGALGLVLLGGALMLMVTQPVAGALVARRGSAPLTLAGGVAYAGALVLAGLAPAALSFATAILVFAGASGVLDVSMNAQAFAVSQRHPREIFASFHAAFSFGALGGAAAGGLAAGAGLGPAAHLAIAAAALAGVMLIVVRPGLLPAGADASAAAPRFARPTPALTMGFGRLAADPLAERFGDRAVMRGGGVIAAAGLAVALVAGTAAIAIAGFTVMGAGLAGVFPLALRNAAASGGGAAAPAIAAVSTTGYVGFVAGPALIGLLSDATSLPVALVLVVSLCLAMATLAHAGRVA